MLKLSVDYFSSKKFIIDNRFWFYHDRDLYVYDSENKDLTEDSVRDDLNFFHFVKSRFDNIEDMCVTINEHRPISSKTITVSEYTDLLMKSYPTLKTALKGVLSKTEFVNLVDARYTFSMILDEEHKNIILCHDRKYNDVEIEHDETTRRIKKYASITMDTQIRYPMNWSEIVICRLKPEFE